MHLISKQKSIKNNASVTYYTQNRMVTGEDYLSLFWRSPGNYKGKTRQQNLQAVFQDTLIQ